MQIIDILGQLVPNVWTALTQLCATAVLFFLMYKLAWKPVKKILDARSEYESSRLTEADRLREENEKLNVEAKASIEEAQKEVQQILDEAREAGDQLKEQITQEGRKQVEKMRKDAEKDIEKQRNKMLEQMQEEIVDTAVAVAEKILQNKVNAKQDRDNIDTFIKEVIKK
ncbi:MAG: F0F1 ATP synthase subunit B [Erysipelotrichaceae bacterium]|nr:F0F1 ATP synthase subunit B [Erysipelotrichaceae bacterium]